MASPFGYDVQETVTPGVAPTDPSITTPIDAFLGFGLIHPLVRDQKNDFAATGGAALVRSALSQILGTEAETETTEGELAWRSEFGSKLHLLRHRKGRIVQDLGRAYILEAVRRWEPRIVITKVQPSFDREQRAVSFLVGANLIEENVPGNRVVLPNDVEVDVAI